VLYAGELADDEGATESSTVTVSGLLGALSLLPALTLATV
jgi:hypothetical protein